MLKKIQIIILLLILIITIIVPFSYSGFTPNVVELYDGKVIAYSEISALKLTLSNGTVVTSTIINGDTKQNVIQIAEYLQLVLVIDTSGSMSGSSMSNTKEAALTLSENLLALGENVQIGVVNFASTGYLQTMLTHDFGIVQSAIQGLIAAGDTNMLPGLDYARQLLQQGKIDYERSGNKEHQLYQYCVVLTDGVTSNPNGCYDSLKYLNEDMNVSIYGILVGDASDSAFKQDGTTIGEIYENISQDEIWDIYDEIYDMIYEEVIENVIPEFKDKSQNFIILDTGVFITLDSEIMQGAILEIEYIINIKSSIDVYDVQLQDLISEKISFDPDMKLLTEDKTNRDEGWELIEDGSKYQGQKSVAYINETASDEPLIKRRQPLQKKVVYSTLLSSEVDASYGHSTTFRLNKDAVNGTANMNSLPVVVVPPYGDEKFNNVTIITLITLVFIAVILIIILKIKKRK